LRILTFAYVFPPDSGSGTFRTLYFTNEWVSAGDEVTVITVREEDFHEGALVDHQLLKQVHPSIRIVRARVRRPFEALVAMRSKLRRNRPHASEKSGAGTTPSHSTAARNDFRLGDLVSTVLNFPDAHCGWIPAAVNVARKIIARNRIDCIYASGGPWSGLVAATLTHKLTKTPLVLDFRDPWAANPNFEKEPAWVQRWHTRWERFCVKHAARVITNTESLRANFVSRYPTLPPTQFVCVTNGFQKLPTIEKTTTEKFDLIHAGELYLTRNPANFLEALHQLILEGNIARHDVRVRFVGGVPQNDPTVARLLTSLGSAVEVTARLPHADALQLQRESSALLLFQAGLPLQVPRKLFEYFSMGSPVLAITEKNSATATILSEVEMPYVTEDDVSAIKSTLLRLYKDWREGRAHTGNPDRIANYSNERLAGRVREQLLAASMKN
jgi:hypothetical protein